MQRDELLESATVERASFNRRELMLGGGAAAVAALAGTAFPKTARSAPSAADSGAPIEVLFTVYRNGTLLDFAGPNEVLSRIPNVKLRFASPDGGAVQLEHGLVFGNTERLSDVTRTDVLCVPGGPDLSAMRNPAVLQQVRRLADGAKYVTSVCTGSLVLGAAGLLKGKRSACHWACLNLLKEYGAIPDPARIVRDGRFMSGGGVTSGIDFGLALAAELVGAQETQVMQLMIEYNPAPPFHAGHPSTAPREILDIVHKALPGSDKGLLQIG